MSPARYFIAAAIVLLLGAAALPEALLAYAAASGSRELIPTLLGVWSTFVLVTAFAGPLLLTLAGIVSLWTRHDQ